MSRVPEKRYLIIGQGLAGSCLAWALHSESQGQAEVLLIDREKAHGSSRVAAGMVNPVTGKGLNPSWRIQDYLAPAIAFYKKIEADLRLQPDQIFWHDSAIVRLFAGEKEEAKFENKREDLATWISDDPVDLPRAVHNPHGKTVWRGGGWLDTCAFIDATRKTLPIQYDDWENFQKTSLRENDHLIFCQGAEGLLNAENPSPEKGPLNLPNLPKRLAKGEILTVKIPGLNLKEILVRHGWLIPLDPQNLHGKRDYYRVGATYEWDQIDTEATAEAQSRIDEIIRSFTDLPYEIIDHVAGIRPIMRQSRPVIGQTTDGHHLFNGLGSKGTLYAPKVAQHLARHLLHNEPLHRDYLLS